MYPLIFRKALLGASLLFCFGLPLQAEPPAPQVSPALQKAVDQFCAFHLSRRGGSEREPDPQQAIAFARSQKADGSWSDLTYTSAARSGWPPYDHCSRMASMAMAVAGDMDVSAGDRQRLLDGVHRAFRFWIRHDFQCTNWWYNEIGLPKLIGTCALLLGKNLTPDEYAYVTQTSLSRYGIGMTGQNKVWLAGNALMLGLLKGD